MARWVKSGKFLAICFLGFLEVFAVAQGVVIRCGGALGGANGTAEFTLDTDDFETLPKRGNCIWVVWISEGNAIQFKLNDIAQDTSTTLYNHEDEIAVPTELSTADIGSTVTAPGRQIIAILPYKLGAKVSFEWEAVEDDEDENAEGVAYSGILDFRTVGIGFQSKLANGTFVVGVSLELKYSMNFSYSVVFSDYDPKNYITTDFYQVLPNGRLYKYGTFSGPISSGAGFTNMGPELFAWVKFNVANGEEAKFYFKWKEFVPPDNTTTTESTSQPTSTQGLATTV